MMWHSFTERIKILTALTAASEDGSSAVEHAHQPNLRPEALDVIIKLGRQLARNVGRLDEEVVRHLH